MSIWYFLDAGNVFKTFNFVFFVSDFMIHIYDIIIKRFLVLGSKWMQERQVNAPVLYQLGYLYTWLCLTSAIPTPVSIMTEKALYLEVYPEQPKPINKVATKSTKVYDGLHLYVYVCKSFSK